MNVRLNAALFSTVGSWEHAGARSRRLCMIVALTAAATCEPVLPTRSQAARPSKPVQTHELSSISPCVGQVARNLAYGLDREQQVDLYLPRETRGRAPLLVWLHPGGWAGGSREDVHHWALEQTCHGFAVAAVDYRLTGEVRFPEPLLDVRAAIRLLTSRALQDGTDPEQVFVWGASAGGYLAALVGTTSGTSRFEEAIPAPPPIQVQAVVTWWAPIDFGQMDPPLRARCREPLCHGCAHSPESRFLGGEVQSHPELVRAADPLTYVRYGDLPPFLVMHGSADCTVPVEQARLLATGLRKGGGEVVLSIVKGASHGSAEWARTDILRQVTRFLRRVWRRDGGSRSCP